MRHVHIVGMAPRTGTTLLAELMVHCHVFDGYAAHEMSLRHLPDRQVDRFCSKKNRLICGYA